MSHGHKGINDITHHYLQKDIVVNIKLQDNPYNLKLVKTFLFLGT